MSRNSALLAVCFCAGMIGGLANSLFIWLAGGWGLTAMVGVKMAPILTTSWLYPRLIWGGLWGIPYFFSVSTARARRHWVRKALWFSLLPTLSMLFFVFPQQMNLGQGGLKLGLLTPLVVLIANLVWGFFTGIFTRLLWGR